MNEPRVLRFAITPFVFAFWVTLSFVFECGAPPREAPSLRGVGALLGGFAAAALPIGFLISSFTILVLRGIGLLTAAGHIEAALLNRQLTPEEVDRYETATLAHARTPDGLSAWVARRWSAFLTWANSFFATLSAIILTEWIHSRFIHVHCCLEPGWYVAAFSTLPILVINAVCAWQETMGMLIYQHQSQRPRDPRP